MQNLVQIYSAGLIDQMKIHFVRPVRAAIAFGHVILHHGSISRANFMSYYRDIYLKSEDWKSFRKIVLQKQHHTCRLCKTSGFALDVHHLKYKRLWDVTVSDVKVLCRDCHNKVHALMGKYKLLKKLNAGRQWRIVLSHLGLPQERERILDQTVSNAKVYPIYDLEKARLGIDAKPPQIRYESYNHQKFKKYD